MGPPYDRKKEISDGFFPGASRISSENPVFLKTPLLLKIACEAATAQIKHQDPKMGP